MFVEIFDILVGVALAIFGSLYFWPISNGYYFYRPIVLFLAGYVAAFLFMFFFFACIGWCQKKGEQHKKINKFARFFLNNGVWFICYHSHTILKIYGKEKLPKKERFLFVSNHKSNFDPMFMICRMGIKDLALITKASNYKIPIAGHLLPRMCYMALNREDKLQCLEKFKIASDLITNDICSVGVYPEGKRNPDIILGDFHEGCFNIGIHSKCPIAVVTVVGTEKIHKRYPRFTKVTIRVEKVYRESDYAGMTAQALSDEVKQIMLNRLEKQA